jgi:hypothetical protein
MAILGVVAAIGVAAAAIAYWSTSGSGTGSAATSAGAANLTVTATSSPTNMYPGDSAQKLTFTVTNNASNKARVHQVVVSIHDVAQALSATGSCDATDYTLSGGTVTVDQELTSGGTYTVPTASAPTIQFNDKTDTNQDGCKGATVNLAYNAS